MVVETYLDYKDFVRRVDRKKPIHYRIDFNYLDKFRSQAYAVIELTALDKEYQWIVRFSDRELLDRENDELEIIFGNRIMDTLKSLKEKYSVPLKATEGYYE